ncbi:MAG TPA: hypothetical protein VI522_05105 [Gammaproteobacteria bacterium]|nr:hypothetical protein [Gammaproteobacteria bacterium]
MRHLNVLQTIHQQIQDIIDCSRAIEQIASFTQGKTCSRRTLELLSETINLYLEQVHQLQYTVKAINNKQIDKPVTVGLTALNGGSWGEFLLKHRHQDPLLQQLYDKQYALVPVAKFGT